MSDNENRDAEERKAKAFLQDAYCLETIDEVLRVLMSGAYFVCTVHEAIWHGKGFSRTFADLEKCAAIRVIEENSGSFFEGGEPAVRYCVFQKP